MELGLASRSDLLQILNHTVHGGRSVQGVTDGQGESDQNRRLDKSMFPSGSLGNVSEAQGPASPATGNSTDSPGRMFQMDSPAASGLSSPGSLFPVSLERTQSSESVDFALAQEPSVAGGNVFDMTDTAHDDDNGPSMHEFRQAQPPASPAAAEEQQQRSPEQQLQQQQAQALAQQRPPHKRRLYAYGIADPEYMSLPCKMSMKHARVTVNHETNSRLYGKKQPGQVKFWTCCLPPHRGSPFHCSENFGNSNSGSSKTVTYGAITSTSACEQIDILVEMLECAVMSVMTPLLAHASKVMTPTLECAWFSVAGGCFAHQSICGTCSIGNATSVGAIVLW